LPPTRLEHAGRVAPKRTTTATEEVISAATEL
jgi:hypothetical protein